jgi:hypothetical protein
MKEDGKPEIMQILRAVEGIFKVIVPEKDI